MTILNVSFDASSMVFFLLYVVQVQGERGGGGEIPKSSSARREGDGREGDVEGEGVLQ